MSTQDQSNSSLNDTHPFSREPSPSTSPVIDPIYLYDDVTKEYYPISELSEEEREYQTGPFFIKNKNGDILPAFKW
ncbi:hypothetical protein B9479_003093 [Cryptococcus floricola]|uniref:Uncharacterized protein n=1 Tax=Cryptococcus floricola TaxID=2591691 RepID=A0A5D3AZM1_9TREE|nr:hypothetical protein B9479_003093 [Cryptococcus floricola]